MFFVGTITRAIEANHLKSRYDSRLQFNFKETSANVTGYLSLAPTVITAGADVTYERANHGPEQASFQFKRTTKETALLSDRKGTFHLEFTELPDFNVHLDYKLQVRLILI